MPKKKKTEATTQLANPFGILTEYLGEVWADSDIPLDSYKEMLERDETVAASLEFLAFNVANKIGSYLHPDPEISQFVKSALDNMDTPLENLVTRLVINALVYGFAVAEIVWKVEDDKYTIRKVEVIPSETLHAKVENFEIISSIQTTGVRKVIIPREKTVFIKIGSGVLGQSSLRRAWRAYRFKSALFKFWAIAMERYSMPILYGKTADTETLVEQLKDLWVNGIIATDTSTEIELLEPRVNIAGEFRDAIEYANLLIARSLLVPPLLLTTERTGAYSLGRVHFNLFMTAVERLAKIIAEALINDLIYRLITYNFTDVKEYGSFLFRSQPSPEDMSRLALAFNQLVGAGVLDVSTDGDWIRSMLGAPKQKIETYTGYIKEAEKVYEDLFGGGNSNE